MHFIPYLTFNGNCREALQRYAEIFSGDIVAMQRFGDEESCRSMPAETQELIMFGHLKANEAVLFASDDPSNSYELPQSMHISVSFPNVLQAKEVFDQLNDGGETLMPFEKTFFSAGFGMTRDCFGILWMVNVNDPDSDYY